MDNLDQELLTAWAELKKKKFELKGSLKEKKALLKAKEKSQKNLIHYIGLLKNQSQTQETIEGIHRDLEKAIKEYHLKKAQEKRMTNHVLYHITHTYSCHHFCIIKMAYEYDINHFLNHHQ